MVLARAPQGGRQAFVSDAQALSKAMEVATTSETVEAIILKLITQLTDAKLATAPNTPLLDWPKIAEYINSQERMPGGDVLRGLVEYANYVHLRENSNGRHWDGLFQEQTPFQLFHADLAEKAFAKLVDAQALTMDIAISDDASSRSKLLRGYIADTGENIEQDIIDIMDTQFNRWLVLPENGMCSQGGIIYDVDEKGAVKYEQGEAKRADPATLRKKLMDPEKGFASYVEKEAKKQGKSLHVTVREQPYPETAITPSPDEAVDANLSGRGK